MNKLTLIYTNEKKQMTDMDFEKFIQGVSDDFNPPFLSYVNESEYFKKIEKFAEFITCWQGNEIVGLVVLYCNDKENKEGYIPLVAVHKDFRGNGIAKEMMSNAISLAKKKGMQTLKLRTNNPLALKCYVGIGFVIYDQIYEIENQLDRFYLKKQL